MHRLTIEHADHGTSTSSEYPDPADAKRALARYVEHADCRTDTIQMHTDFSSWDLITLGDNRVHATATIEQCSESASDDAHFAELKVVLDHAVAVDTGIACVDNYERAIAHRKCDPLTGSAGHFHRASCPPKPDGSTMHQLTITAETGTSTTTHHDYNAASRALLNHAKLSDTYLHTLAGPEAQRACFHLISLNRAHGRPNVTAAAIIEPVVSTASGRLISPYYAAGAALHWTSDLHSDSRWRHTDHAHPALAAARAAAQSPLNVSSLWYEAITLADLTDIPLPPTHMLDNLRHEVITRGVRLSSPADLAASVQYHFASAVTPEQAVVATWWTALLARSLTPT